jgi:A/G-specific adenine glycosylase
MKMTCSTRGRAMSTALLDWYDRHRRALPWRAPPGARADPYHVWLSEIMLQQTTVAAVGPYFERFVRAWPRVEALAAAPLGHVLKAWAGLGYYARARNLHKCAIAVAGRHGGRFPDAEAALRELPGIGTYTAGAIAAIAFDRRAVAVDGNVERVLARAFAVETPLPDAKPAIRARAQALVPDTRCGDFAQALMDLGATICAPRRANCLVCPWAAQCEGRAAGLQDVLPRKRARAERPTRRGVAFWITREDGAVLVRSRPHEGLLGGMTEFPSTVWREQGAGADPAAEAPVEAAWRPLQGAVRHTFTHFHLELGVWACAPLPAAAATRADGWWVQPEALAGEALPTVMRKIASLALGKAVKV